MERLDIFTGPHKALRTTVYNLATKIGALDFKNEKEVASIKDDMDFFLLFFRLHSHFEDEFIFPPFEERMPGVTSSTSKEHDDLDPKLDEIERLFGTILSTQDGKRAALGLRLYREINDFVPGYLSHLKNEEEDLMPKVWERFSDDEIMKINSSAMSKVSPGDMARVLPVIFRSLNIDERTGMLMVIKKNAPPQALEAIVGTVKKALSQEDWSALAKRVGL